MIKGIKKSLAMLLTSAMVFSGMQVEAWADTTATNGDVTIQILATSDTHGRFLPYDYALNQEDTSGSLAQISTIVTKLRSENKNTVLIDTGDVIQDNSSELFLKDKVHPMIAAMNLMDYDVCVPGNHEFNYGMTTLKKILKENDAKTLAGNVYNKDGSRLADNYTIIEKDGVKIGIIGVVTPNITRWDAENLKGYKVTDPVTETKAAIKALDGKVDVMIAAVHMSESNEYDVADSGVEDLTKACPDLDLVIAAHEHKAVAGVEHNGVLTVENKSGGQTLAQVNITVNKKSDGTYEVKNEDSKLITVKGTEADAKLVSALTSYQDRAIKNANVVIGTLKGGDLVGTDEINGIPQSQIAESAMINLINNVQMYYTGADVSAAAAFNPTANMKEGEIKRCDTALIYKYANTLYKMKMTGKQLKKFMEWSACYYNTYKEGDLTVSFNPDIRGYNYDMFSGLSYEVNISKEPWNRIENVRKADGTLLKDTDVLIVAVNNYRASSQLLSYGPIYEKGVDTLPTLLEKDVAGNIGGVRELIGDYITNVKKGVITPQLENNWKITGTDWDQSKHAAVASLVRNGLVTIPTSEDGRTPNVKSVTIADLTGKATVDSTPRTLYTGGTTGETVTLGTVGDTTAITGVTYTSASPEIAEVSETGVVTAKKAGTVNITAKVTLADKTTHEAVTAVTVQKAAVKVNSAKISLNKGKTAAIKVTLMGYKASDLSWSSTAKTVKLTTSKTGLTAKVKGLKPGKATIKVKAGSSIKTVKITIKK